MRISSPCLALSLETLSWSYSERKIILYGHEPLRGEYQAIHLPEALGSLVEKQKTIFAFPTAYTFLKTLFSFQ